MFEAKHLPGSPLWILLHSWSVDFRSRRFLADLAINVAIYMPLGMSGYLAFRRSKSTVLALLAPIAIGTALSACIEMLQLFTPHRESSAVDLSANILGSALGVLAGIWFQEIVEIPGTGPGFVPRDRGAVVLLFVWVAFLLFPLFPVSTLFDWEVRIVALIHGPLFRPIPIFLSAAEWFAVGRLLVAAGVKSPLGWLLGMLVLVPVQLGIVDHDVLPFDFVGPLIGLLLFVAVRNGCNAHVMAGVLLAAALTLRGLEPFHFAPATQEFSWIPFIGLLATPWQSAISILLGKLFQYGAALWLLSRFPMGMAGAAVLVTLLLAAIEALQTRIPGHASEITDPVLAILLGLIFLLSRGSRPSDAAGPRYTR